MAKQYLKYTKGHANSGENSGDSENKAAKMSGGRWIRPENPEMKGG